MSLPAAAQRGQLILAVRRWPALWAFSRPHTVIGTSLSLLSLCAIITLRGPVDAGGRADLAALVAVTWLAALAANVYIVGLNQITDVALDRVNKPDLPLASGAMRRREATRLVAFSGAMALGLGLLLGRALLATFALSLLIGSAYSLPPLRLKGSAIGAPLCIALVRGPLVNLGLGVHLAAILSAGPARPGTLPPEVWLVTLFMSLAALGIGIAKDLPDVAGDRAHGIGNLAVRRGPESALAVSTRLWALAYVLTAVIALVTLPRTAGLVMVAAHGAALLALIRSARSVRPEEGAGVRRHYRLLWRLLYAEYLLMPLVAALAARQL